MTTTNTKDESMTFHPQVWAHRGASASCPENTLDAFRRAVEVSADGIELDVQRSADGRLVVIHDETLDRTTSGSGRVVDLVWDDIRAVDASNGQDGFSSRIPLLDEVLELLAPTTMMLNVELKNSVELYPGMDLQVVEAVRAAGMTERVILSSFNHVSLAQTHESDLGLPLGLLYGEPLWRMDEYATRFGAQSVHPYYRFLFEPGVVDRFKAAGLAINTWTVDDPEALRRLADLEVDAVICNDPAAALALYA